MYIVLRDIIALLILEVRLDVSKYILNLRRHAFHKGFRGQNG